MTFDAKNMTCTLLPGKYGDPGPVPPIYNDVYHYWKTFWLAELTRVGDPKALNVENFLRQSFITALHKDGELIGTVSSTVFNLSAETTYDHPFLSPFPPPVIERMRSQGAGYAVTGEYMSVRPEFRKSITGISFADVLVGMVMRISLALEAKISLATLVRFFKVPNNCKKFGYVELGDYTKYGVGCTMVFNDREHYHEHPDPQVASLIQDLWENRRDLTGLTGAETSQPFRRAA